LKHFRAACGICGAAALTSVALTAVLCARTAHVYHFHRRRMLPRGTCAVHRGTAAL
jgi:hypothetical protein